MTNKACCYYPQKDSNQQCWWQQPLATRELKARSSTPLLFPISVGSTYAFHIIQIRYR